MSSISCFFFFSSRRRHTRSLCDWSSDVCSSDLAAAMESSSGNHHRHWQPALLESRPRYSYSATLESLIDIRTVIRSEERRVGKECRYSRSREFETQKMIII